MSRAIAVLATVALAVTSASCIADELPPPPAPSPSPVPTSATRPSIPAAAIPSPTFRPTPRGRTDGILPSPSNGESFPAAEDVPAAYLSGPFGTLDGIVSTDGSWPATADMRPLDTLAESVPLTAGYRDLDLEFVSWSASVAPASGATDGAAIVLAGGPGPDERRDLILLDGPRAGEWFLRLRVVSSDAPAAAYHWHLSVPDRAIPAGQTLSPTMPDLVLSADDTQVIADPGQSCFVDTCNDFGGPLPAERLPVLVARAGGTVGFSLDDGSGFTSWTVSAWHPGDRDGSDARVLGAGELAQGMTGGDVVAPGRGQWILELAIRFDLERGHARYYVRVDIP